MNPRILPCLVCLCLASSMINLRAEIDPEREEFDDSVFVGMKISIVIDDEQYPLTRFANDYRFIEKDGAEIGLKPPVKLNFRKTIRHSVSFAEVTDYTTQPLSSAQAEALKRFADAQAVRSMHSANLETAMLRQAQFRELTPSTAPPGVDVDEYNATNQMELSAAVVGAQEDLQSFDEVMDKMRGDIGSVDVEKNFDALQIKFKVIPEEDLDDCFFFVRASYRALTEGKPGERTYNVTFVEVGDLKAGVAKPVTFIMRGFPPGPQIEEMSYHLYSGQREIPTTYAEQRIPLSEDEAYDFLYANLFSYDVPENAEPQLFKHLPTHMVEGRLSPATIDSAVVAVTVGPDGETRNIEVSACPPSETPKVIDVVSRARFLPALEDGVPATREISMPLRSLLR